MLKTVAFESCCYHHAVNCWRKQKRKKKKRENSLLGLFA